MLQQLLKMIRPGSKPKPLPTFDGALKWPRNIESRMSQAELLEKLGMLGQAVKTAHADNDEQAIAMFADMQENIGEVGLDAACRELAQKNPSERIHQLSHWIELAKRCGIPHVPIEIGPLVSTENIEQTHEALHYGEPDALPAAITKTVLPWIQEQQARGWMWRYEFCASQTIKEILGCIRPDHYLDTTQVKIPFSVDDRVLHCMWDTGLEQSNLLARPWIRAAFEAGFPVEFRVFRTKTGWAACNYYIQRPLDAQWMPILEKAMELAQQFEATAQQAGNHLPSEYTTDWIVTRDEQLLLLEAGPGFTPTGGAHPCCFNPKSDMTGKLLLANEEGAIFWCPPEIQIHVDQIKNGAHPLEVAQAAKMNPQMLISQAAIQGHQVSQHVQRAIQENRFLEWEQAVKELEAAGG